MIDVHTHIIPAFDDGCKTVEQSQELLNVSKEKGINAIVATPHYLSKESPEEFIKKRDKAIEELKKIDTSVDIYVGAEVGYFFGMSRSDSIELLTIGGTRYILIEMPETRWGDFEINELLSVKNHLGLVPIIAHIERVLSFKNEKHLEKLIREGCITQSNAEFFIDKKTRRKAEKLLKAGLIMTLGSDMHRPDKRPQNLDEALNIIQQDLGEHYVERIKSVAYHITKHAEKVN